MPWPSANRYATKNEWRDGGIPDAAIPDMKGATHRRAAASPSGKPPRRRVRRWSQRVTETSDALDLEPEVFRKARPEDIALSLKQSAEQSKRRKSNPYRSSMSMLTFYVNRAGKSLTEERRKTLERAKEELRSLFGRNGSPPKRSIDSRRMAHHGR
jgi:hypothetical protein